MAKKFSRMVSGYMKSILAFIVALTLLYVLIVGGYALATGVVG